MKKLMFHGVLAYNPGTSLNKRSFARMKEGNLSTLFDIPKILVQIVSDGENITAHLFDLCKGGLAVNLLTSPTINLTGDYVWQQSRQIAQGKFRPLRMLAAGLSVRFLSVS